VKELAVVYWYNYEQEIEDPYYLSIRLAIEQKAEEYGYRVHTVSPSNIDSLTPGAVGVIVLGRLEDDAMLDTLKEQFENVIVVDNNFARHDIDYVGSDFALATRNALDYLYKLGHRRIARIGGGIIADDAEGFLDQRDVVYKQFMKEHGIYNEELIHWCSVSTKEAFKTTNDVLKIEPRPTAILVNNDSMAIGVYRAVAEAGLRIPEDISVLSFNDQPSAKYMMPPLTSVRIYTKFIGFASVDLIAEKERVSREYSKNIVLPTELKIRRSCAQANE
ncbi:MAG: substrate-binding domain-containing protein, partial [Lachnospiraceae bacterium]|nr:substrate-binding domain-containing protein [Lachnospiraceae bacterium]